MDEPPDKPPAPPENPNRARAEFGELLHEAARISFETGNDAYERALRAMGIVPGDPRYANALRSFESYCRERRSPEAL